MVAAAGRKREERKGPRDFRGDQEEEALVTEAKSNTGLLGVLF